MNNIFRIAVTRQQPKEHDVVATYSAPSVREALNKFGWDESMPVLFVWNNSTFLGRVTDILH